MSQTLAFRPITDEDLEFLYQVYASTRADEMALTGWPPEEQEKFLRMQSHAQHTHYQQHYADARFEVILLNGQPAGRLYVQRGEQEFCVIDIALLPKYRGHGIGGGIMRDLLDEARAAGKPVRIHVEFNNPAMQLYQRLGFKKVEERGVYHLMKWTP